MSSATRDIRSLILWAPNTGQGGTPLVNLVDEYDAAIVELARHVAADRAGVEWM